MYRRVAIVGAGAIGGCLGLRLAALDDLRLSVLARGATLEALRRDGWRMQTADGALQASVQASDDASALGVQDLVVIAVKGPALASVARDVGPLIGPRTVILPAMNGVPWWFGRGLTGAAQDLTLSSVDPGGAAALAMPPPQVIGCVVHIAAAAAAPAVVQHRFGWTLFVGEPTGGRSERLDALETLLQRAGFEVKVPASIHHEAWYKLWGNITMNPVSALTGATGDRILDDPLVRAFCSAVMSEVAEVGARIGCGIDQTPEDRHTITRELGAFKTSMLQDVEAGRPVELDAIVGAAREIAERVGVATPSLDALFGLTRLMAQSRGLYGAAPG